MWLQVYAGICASDLLWMCVRTCLRLQVWLCLLCPAPHRYKTEMCRHLRECVPLRFLNGCRARPNAPRAQTESSATCLPPYMAVPARFTVWGTWGNLFYLYPFLSSFIFLTCCSKDSGRIISNENKVWHEKGLALDYVL